MEIFGGIRWLYYICSVIDKERNDEEAIQAIYWSRFSRRRQLSESHYYFPGDSSGFAVVLVRYP